MTKVIFLFWARRGRVGLATAAWVGRADVARWRGRILLFRRPPGLSAILGRSAPQLLLNGVVLTLMAAALGFAVLHYTGIDYHRFRIFGFSEGSFGTHSLRGRLEIISPKLPHAIRLYARCSEILRRML